MSCLLLQLGDHLDDRQLRGLDVSRRSLAAQLVDHRSGLVDHASGDLGPADVDPDRERHSRTDGPGQAPPRQPSARFFSPARARSMITRSALRRIIPSIGIATPTESR